MWQPRRLNGDLDVLLQWVDEKDGLGENASAVIVSRKASRQLAGR